MTKTLRIALMTAAAVGLSGGALAQERGEHYEEAQDLMNPSEAYEAEAGPSGSPLSPVPDTTGEPMAVRVTPTDKAASASADDAAAAEGADGIALNDDATDWSGVTEPRPANDPPQQRMAADDDSASASGSAASGAAAGGASGAAGADRIEPTDSAVGAQSPGSRADFGLDNAGAEAAQDAEADRGMTDAQTDDAQTDTEADPLDDTAAAAGGATAGGDNPDLGTYDQEGTAAADDSGLEANRPDPLDDDEVNLGAGAEDPDLANVDTSDGVTPIEERQINRAAGEPGVPATEAEAFPERAGVPGPGGLSNGASTVNPPGG